MPRHPGRVGTPPPRNLELELRRALRPMLKSVRALVGSGRVRTEADARAVGAALRKAWPDKRIAAIVRAIARKGEASASRPWGALARAEAKAKASAKTDARMDAGEYDAEVVIEAWTRQAAKLITSVRDEVSDGLRRDIIEAARTGASAEDLAGEWRREGIPLKFGTLEGRTKVIAQHQLSTLHAEVARARATAIGVEEFVWRSQGDARVRPSHRALDGRTFPYAAPPGSEGLPGTPVNCRCWAESVISDELLGELGIEAII